MKRSSLLVLLLTLIPVTLATASAPTTPFELTECAYSELAVKVDPALVRPFVPAAFQVKVFADGTATVVHGAAHCASAVSGDAHGTGTFAYTSVKIDEPADAALRGQLIAVYFYRLEHWGNGDLYTQASLAAGAGDLRVAQIQPRIDLASGGIDVAAAEGTHRVTAGPEPGGVGGSHAHWREFGAASGGYAFLDASLAPDAGASTTAAIVRPAAGTITHAVLGDVNAGPLEYGRAFGVLDGTLGFVASSS